VPFTFGLQVLFSGDQFHSRYFIIEQSLFGLQLAFQLGTYLCIGRRPCRYPRHCATDIYNGRFVVQRFASIPFLAGFYLGSDMENVVQAVGEIVCNRASLSHDSGVTRGALLDGRLFWLSSPIMVYVVLHIFETICVLGYLGVSIHSVLNRLLISNLHHHPIFLHQYNYYYHGH
jgi:hypothetical protein